MSTSMLRYKGRRYLWVALATLVASIVVYLSQPVDLPRNGGSWQGYALGGLGAFLILLLLYLGIRKRQYRSAMGTLQGWASAHVYLGLVLGIIATLHASFQLGFNIHSFAYILMWLVIVSGLYGLYAYNRHPALMVLNRENESTAAWLDELDDTQKDIAQRAARCDADVRLMIESALDGTRVGGGLRQQVSGTDRSTLDMRGKSVANPDQRALLKALGAKVPQASSSAEAEQLQVLLELVGRRAELLAALRGELKLQTRLRLWLHIHVPLSLALLAALSIHVFTVFFYW